MFILHVVINITMTKQVTNVNTSKIENYITLCQKSLWMKYLHCLIMQLNITVSYRYRIQSFSKLFIFIICTSSNQQAKMTKCPICRLLQYMSTTLLNNIDTEVSLKLLNYKRTLICDFTNKTVNYYSYCPPPS